MPQAAVLRLLYFLLFCCTASWLPVLADYCRSKGLTDTQTCLILSMEYPETYVHIGGHSGPR